MALAVSREGYVFHVEVGLVSHGLGEWGQKPSELFVDLIN